MPIRRVDTTEIEYNSGDNTYTLPTTRGTDNYVLTRDDSVGTGGTAWKETITTPSITNVTGEINEDTNTNLTVTGNNFDSGMTIKLINASTNADITGHTALSYSGSSSPITVTIPSATTNITAGTQVKLVIDKQGLTTTSDAITVSEDPNWTTTSGTFATINDTLGASQTVGTLSASAGAGGGTIVYASDDSSLDTTYFSLNTSSGVITTTSTALTGLTGSGNYTESFNANAKIQGSESTKNTLLSGINIIINKTYELHFLLVGGGGGGGHERGGGGGGGAVRTTWASDSAGGGASRDSALSLIGGTVVTVTVGAGGVKGISTSGQRDGGNGGNSILTFTNSYSTITANGGGGGGTNNGDGRANGNASSGGGGSDGGTANTSGTYGYDGGDGLGSEASGTYRRIGGGGGGAGAVGKTATSTSGPEPNGGIGVTSSITGSTLYLAGGGGSGGATGRGRGADGNGVYGAGDGGASGVGGDGTNGTGSGAGGGHGSSNNYDGGTGGSGRVVLAVPTGIVNNNGFAVAGNASSGTNSGYTWYNFTATSGTLTLTMPS